jgi:polysaccharide export outer membrane protein
MKFLRTLLLLALPVYFISCGTQHKLPNYLENVTDTTGKGDVKFPELLIQKNDQLSIQIYSLSTLPEKSDILYNLPSTNAGGQGTMTGGYLVDANGNIEIPRLGAFHAEGLTKQELAAQIKKKLTEPVELLKDPTVIIRFLNYKVTVIGQVGHEGVMSVPGERLTILEAIGLAGGITDYGKKENVKIIRETNGKREFGIIDLSSKNVFESPYYNLMQNDMIIVEPTNQKAKQTEQALVNQKLTIALSLITTAALLYNIFK